MPFVPTTPTIPWFHRKPHRRRSKQVTKAVTKDKPHCSQAVGYVRPNNAGDAYYLYCPACGAREFRSQQPAPSGEHRVERPSDPVELHPERGVVLVPPTPIECAIARAVEVGEKDDPPE